MLRITAIALLAASAATAPPPTARELYNLGLQKMRTNDLREAESSLLDAARTNQRSVQPLATYNLGHVRFLQGKEILSGEGNRQQLLDNAEAGVTVAEEALRSAKRALLSEEDLRGLVSAYNEAREARKNLRTPRDETSRAMALLGSALSRWRKSADGFNSAFELDPSNEDADFNAKVVQKHIDELVKFQKKMEQQSDAISQERKELGKAMKDLRGKIPKDMQRENDGEEDEDDEEEEGQPKDPKEEQKPKGEDPKQQQQRLGSGREIDPDVLKMLKEKIDRQRRTMSPDAGDQPSKPQGRSGRDW